METILATAFGYKVNLQKGEVEGGDELIAAAAGVFNIPLAGPAGALLQILHCKCTLNSNCSTSIQLAAK